MIWIIANTMSEYIRFLRTYQVLDRTRYVATSKEINGVRGEVIIVNDGHFKFDTTAHDTLESYEELKLVRVTRAEI